MNYRKKDRFSDLPDNILCYILSLLPTKDAIKTTFLSTSSRGLFLHLRKIHIDHSVHPQMVPFISRLLSSSEVGPLTDFIVESESLPQPHVMVSWLNALLLRRAKVVHVVDLSVYGASGYIDLPHEFFMSDTLEDLKVCGRNLRVFFPESANCPNLKTLHLKCDKMYPLGINTSNIRLGDEAYPKLEDLEMEFASSKYVLSIYLSTLKRLRFTFLGHNSCYNENIEIYTPQLQNLDFIVPHSLRDREWGIPQIHEIRYRKCHSLQSAVLWYFNPARVFMSVLFSMSSVKKLHFIEGFQMEVNYLAADLTRFPNLTYLKLTNAYSDSVWFFLERAPNLETFVYDGGCAAHFSDSDLPTNALREVRLRGLYWDKDEDAAIRKKDCLVEVASFFLQHGAFLESLIIEYPRRRRRRPVSTLKKLNGVNRLSTRCLIELREEE